MPEFSYPGIGYIQAGDAIGIIKFAVWFLDAVHDFQKKCLTQYWSTRYVTCQRKIPIASPPQYYLKKRILWSFEFYLHNFQIFEEILQPFFLQEMHAKEQPKIIVWHF